MDPLVARAAVQFFAAGLWSLLDAAGSVITHFEDVLDSFSVEGIVPSTEQALARAVSGIPQSIYQWRLIVTVVYSLRPAHAPASLQSSPVAGSCCRTISVNVFV